MKFQSAVLIASALAVVSPSAVAQQVSDSTFLFANDRPAFAGTEHPVVCIDAGHHNYHTADGRYKPFADLVRGDGYDVIGIEQGFSRTTLAGCQLLVVANALAADNDGNWRYPHASAFSRSEIEELMLWVRDGGRLLVFADHAPFGGAARDLAAVFGVLMVDAYASGGSGPDVFSGSDRSLMDHPIVDGRQRDERVDSVLTFTGQAFRTTEGWRPLLVFGPEAAASFHPGQSFRDGTPADAPTFSVAGWVQAATRIWDAGRVAFVGEAGMCTAQLAGPQRWPMGMNHPRAGQNAQFCLNTVRWLTGVLE